jgi:hypothetical protein
MAVRGIDRVVVATDDDRIAIGPGFRGRGGDDLLGRCERHRALCRGG